MTVGIAAPLRLEGFRELSARRAALSARLRPMTGEEVVTTVEAMLVAAAERPQSCAASTLALTSWLVRRHEANALGALHELAVARELALTPLLLAARPDGRALPAHGRLPEVPLHRYAPVTFPLPASVAAIANAKTDGWGGFEVVHDLSRRPSFRHLYVVNRLCAHPDPVFIRRLLDAPWLRRPEVLLIASRRPTVAGIAYAIARHDRWLVDPHVRSALISNPFSPPGLLSSLLPMASRGELARLGDSGPIAEAAAAFCARRHAA